MRKFLILVIFSLCSCSSNLTNNAGKDLNFSDPMNFDEFLTKLKIYAKNKSYPNIDN
jgi:hypothetical protein